MVGIGLQARSAQHRSPGCCINALRILALAAVDHDFRGGVVSKMRRVDDQLPGKSDEPKPKHHKVVSCVSSTPGLPAFAHRSRAVRANEEPGRGVEVVAAGHYSAAVPLAREVYRKCIDLARGRDDLTVDPESGDSPIGKD